MATDQATADYEREQAQRAAREDNWADWLESEIPSSVSQSIPKGCAQCINWQAARQLHLADSTTRLRPGFCTVRAAADLPQLPQDYAERCQLYAEEIPF